MNKVSTATAALIAGLGVAFQTNVIPNKYAGYALILATVLQAFQKPVVKPSEPTS